MSRAYPLETIFNHLNGAAIYVISQKNNTVLYFNEPVREILPDIQIGQICSEILELDCKKCSLTGIAGDESGTVTRFIRATGQKVDLTTTPAQWDNQDAFIISIVPHKQDEAEKKREQERKKLGDVTAKLYPRAFSVNLTQNTYTVLHDHLTTSSPMPFSGIYDELFNAATSRIHPDYRDEFIKLFSRQNLLARHAAGETEVTLQHRHSYNNQDYRWIESHAIIVDNPDNDDVLEITLLRNIEENKQKEILLEEENKAKTRLLHQALKNTSMYEFYYYPEKNVIIVPPRMAQRWGTRERYDNAPFDMADDLMHEKDRKHYCELFKTITESGQTASGSYRVKQGGWREISLSTISTDDNGKPTFIVGISRDITENKIAELENVKLQSIYDFTITRNYDCLLIWNVETHTYEARFSGTLEKAGMPRSGSNREGIQTFAELFICEEERSLFLNEIVSTAFLDKLDNREEDIHFYVRCPQEDGFRHKQLSFCYIDKSRSRILMTMRDIDDMIRKEEQNRSALTKAFEAAKSANEAKGDSLSRMSHDMRTPMNAIIGMTTIGRANRNNPARVLDCMDKIEVSSQHLLNLINEVLEMSQIDSGKLVLADEPFSLSDLIQDMLIMVRPDLKRKNHDLKVSVGNVRNEQVTGDKQHISEVFVNIMVNAIKYTPANGQISFSMRETESGMAGVGCYQFIFEDNGIGISPEFQSKIFDPFERAEDSRTNHIQGTGLGMSIALNIVKMMNGSIDVESEIGIGSRFTVTLYLKQQKTATAIHSPKRFHILVADSEKESRENTSQLLHELGMKSEQAASASEALDKIRAADKTKTPFDAIIADWKMADTNGTRIADLIAFETLEKTPSLIVSTDDWTTIGQNTQKAGISTCVQKPIFKSTLASTLQTVLVNGKKTPEAVQKTEIAVTPRFDNKKILLVEDNELNAEIAAELIYMTGASVDIAENGKIAIDTFLSFPEHHYDLIFMDVQMPVMNGNEATKAIRQLDKNDAKTIPIISMSANTFPEDIKLAKSSGMNDHIPKPLDITHLGNIMKKWLA